MFRSYIDKDVTIAVEDMRTNDFFVASGVTVSYVWNKSPIDGTDILCSIPEIGR